MNTEKTDKLDDSGRRISYGEGKAIREPSDGKGRYDLISPYAMRRLAQHYENGAKKYTDRNWERGIPFSRYIDSAKRHIDKFIMGMEDEDHLSAAIWNLCAIIHHEELGQKELDDMPHYERVFELIRTPLTSGKIVGSEIRITPNPHWDILPTENDPQWKISSEAMWVGNEK